MTSHLKKYAIFYGQKDQTLKKYLKSSNILTRFSINNIHQSPTLEKVVKALMLDELLFECNPLIGLASLSVYTRLSPVTDPKGASPSYRFGFSISWVFSGFPGGR